MGGWERNVIIFGGAGILAVAGLFISGNVILGMLWTFLVLAVAMFLALGRFGPDRATLEEYLLRRWRYSRSVKRYTYVQPGQQPQRPASVASPPPAPTPPSVTPVTFAEDRGAYFGAMAVIFVVAGVVFIGWLWRGGDAALAHSLQMFIGR